MFIGGIKAIDWNNLGSIDNIGGLLMLAANLIAIIVLIAAGVIGAYQYNEPERKAKKQQKEHKKVYYAILANSIHRYDHK